VGRVWVVGAVALVLAVAADAAGRGPVMSEASYRYLDHALSLMRQHVVDRNRVDWPVIRDGALELARGAQQPAQTYPAIDHALAAIGNPHSVLVRPPDQARIAAQDALALPRASLVDDRFAQLVIPSFAGSDQGVEHYVRAGVAAVRDMDAAGACGWIVDLRDDKGGNMWPMIAVLAPLLGDGVLGAFVEPDGARTEWTASAGQVTLGGTATTTAPNQVTLTHPNPPVAVLISDQTASAGEAALIAFLGLDRVSTFGRPTAGYATANEGYPLADGAMLLLTTAYDVDRTGRRYDNTPIPPDHLLPHNASPGTTLLAASTWLRTQPACR
jgi:carboxyl-terminal processing protease